MNDNDPPPSSDGGPIASSPEKQRHRRYREIQLQNPCRYPEASARRIRPWLGPVVDAIAPGPSSLVVRFVSDREMRRLNGTYRRKDRPTDVLSFPGSPAEDPWPPPPAASRAGGSTSGAVSPASGPTSLAAGEPSHLGDVVISVPTARRQAHERGHTAEHELRILMIHGLLHCAGYDHETDDGEMEALEEQLRARWLEGSA